MQIDHDPNEKRGGLSVVWFFATAGLLSAGLAIRRGDFEGFSYAETVGLCLIGISAGVIYFTAIHYMLKGWDWLWARLTGGASR